MSLDRFSGWESAAMSTEEIASGTSPLSTVGPDPWGLAERYAWVRGATLALCSCLSPEDQMLQPMPDASPAKWHQAHTTWFFETFVLLPHATRYRPFDPRFTFLFNSYYEQLAGHPVRANRGLLSRPSLDEVRAYRQYVDEHILGLLAADNAEVAAVVELGLQHEQQHQELILTDVKYALWMQPLRPTYKAGPAEVGGEATPSRWFDFEGGIYWIGHPGRGFSFDNETPRHRVFLRPFRLASRLVTSGEYLAFMEDGGYRRPELWLSQGWEMVGAQGWLAPLYWEQRDGEWWQSTLRGERRVNAAEPVCHVSYFEADAYARWAAARLATEQEWEICAAQAPVEGNFVENERFHPAPALTKDSPAQLFGDLWEWTASPYVGYPGFVPVQGALGEYNGKFMCNQLVLRGGSCSTPRSHIRATYRNFFSAPARWQFSGIRLAHDR
jgi:ergothioneine biosynthesis protein EgtB